MLRLGELKQVKVGECGKDFRLGKFGQVKVRLSYIKLRKEKLNWGYVTFSCNKATNLRLGHIELRLCCVEVTG